MFRSIPRFFQFGCIAFSAIADYWINFAFRKNKSTLPDRALWLQRHCRRVLKMFGLTPRVSGTIPSRGLLISNHLSYLDIIVISAITPAVFVAKREVRSWPVLGLLARLGGTLFVDRARKMQVGETSDEIQKALQSGVLVVLFPEGTSTNGQSVLPFRSALLEPAAGRTHPLFIGCIHYSLDDGDAGEEVCYWGDHTFFPHMLNLLGKQAVHATVQFAPFDTAVTDRKELAAKLREEILKLKDGSVLANPPV